MNMDEKQTREQLIDKQLKSVGWLKNYIKEEVNSVSSKFKIKEYVLSQGQGDDSGRFIDYLLLAEDNSPIALIRSNSPEEVLPVSSLDNLLSCFLKQLLQ